MLVLIESKSYLVLLFLCFIDVLSLNAQLTVYGKVTDNQTNEPVAFANVFFKGTTVGTMTDFNGEYKFSFLELPSDTIVSSFIGYVKAENKITLNQNIEVNFEIVPDVFGIEEVIIRPGENPAHIILKEVWSRKKQQNPEGIAFCEYEVYERSQLYIRKFGDKQKEVKRGPYKKEYQQYALSTGENSIPALPAYTLETISQVYRKNNPKRQKTVIVANNSEGVSFEQTEMVQQLTAKQREVNFYRNSVSLLDKNFISPLSNLGLVYYKYRLSDTILIDGLRCYEIQFFPKSTKELAFSGAIWIADSVWSLKRISVEIGKEANLNFFQRLSIQQELGQVDSTHWLPIQTKIAADAVNLFVTMYSNKSNLTSGYERSHSFYSKEMEIMPDVNEYETLFWEEKRAGKYDALDSLTIKNIRALKGSGKVKFTGILIEGSIRGYFPFGPLELGPYTLIYNQNDVEGHRFRLGYRTNAKFSKNWIVNGHIAYGTKDNKLKYSGQLERFISRKSWSKIGVFASDDVQPVGGIQNFFEDDAFLTFAGISGGSGKMAKNVIGRGWLETDLIKGLSTKVSFSYNQFTPLSQEFIFEYFTNEDKVLTSSSFSNAEAAISLNYRPGATLVIDGNRRFPVFFKHYPIFSINYHHGFKDLLKSDFVYDKIDLNVKQKVFFSGFGMLDYRVGYTKYFGAIPYPLLYMPSGNESVFRSNQTYNLMGLGEFVTDQAMELFFSYHFDGIIMNRIPLIKKLDLRLVTDGHIIFGSFDNERNGFFDPINNPNGILPQTDIEGNLLSSFNTLSFDQPYIELSYGIENILKFIRIDAIHRLTYLDSSKNDFGIKVSGVFRF